MQPQNREFSLSGASRGDENEAETTIEGNNRNGDCQPNPSISVQSVVSAFPEQVSCDLLGEAVILDLRKGIYYGLNEVGAQVWALIQQPRTISEIHDAISACTGLGIAGSASVGYAMSPNWCVSIGIGTGDRF